MGQCSNRGTEDKYDATFHAVSLEKAKTLSSNAAVTAARYHFSQGGRKLTDDYEVDGKVLGQGLCGDVVLVRGRVDQRRYAMKTIRKQQVATSKLQQLTSEVEIYLTLDHPNIARLHNVYETEAEISLCTECCEGGELYFRLQKRGVYNDADAAEAARQMLRAIGYLHAHRVVHRDLKLENFLYEGAEGQEVPPQLKLIDFGFAKIWDPTTLMMASCGSIAYVSPDVLSGKGYTSKCDLWSLGVIVWMLLAGYPPFHGEEKLMMSKIKAGQADWSHKSRWKPVSDEAVDFLKQLLCRDPLRRPSASEALHHRWLLRTEDPSPAVLGRDVLRSLQRYSKASKIRRAILQLIAQELSPAETRDLREIFLAVDRSNEGAIRLRDLKDAIRSGREGSPTRRRKTGTEVLSGIPTPCVALSNSPRQPSSRSPVHAGAGDLSPTTPARTLRRADSRVLSDLFGMLDTNGDERIYYSDFLAATMEVRSGLRPEAVRAAFNRFDADLSGGISVADVRATLGDVFEGSSAEDLIAQAELDGRAEIAFDDFVRVVQDKDCSPASTPTGYGKGKGFCGSPLQRRFPETTEALGGC